MGTVASPTMFSNSTFFCPPSRNSERANAIGSQRSKACCVIATKRRNSGVLRCSASPWYGDSTSTRWVRWPSTNTSTAS